MVIAHRTEADSVRTLRKAFRAIDTGGEGYKKAAAKAAAYEKARAEEIARIGIAQPPKRPSIPRGLAPSRPLLPRNTCSRVRVERCSKKLPASPADLSK